MKTILITGCSSGIGRQLALELQNRGHAVWATARRPESLQDLQAHGIVTAALDVDDAASIADLGAMKALAADTFRLVTEEAIQLHGGIGLTDEYWCHLFMKRSMLNLQLCGSVDHWREQAGRQALARY